jgi:hypothetical protein
MAETETTSRPTNDAYTGMLAIALLALIAGSALMFLDFSQYPTGKPNPLPKQKDTPALPKVDAPKAVEPSPDDKKDEPKKDDGKEEMKKDADKKDEPKKDDGKKDEPKKAAQLQPAPLPLPLLELTGRIEPADLIDVRVPPPGSNWKLPPPPPPIREIDPFFTRDYGRGNDGSRK